MTVSILIAILGLVMLIVPIILWKQEYGDKFITEKMLPIRKTYRTYSILGFFIFLIGDLYIMEFVGMENSLLMWFIIPALVVGNNHLFFEPYYTSEIIPHIEHLCLYLRPFKFTMRDKGFSVQGKWFLPESVEKVLCKRLNKEVAPVFCVGDPKSPIPTTFEASGIYISDAKWKKAVSKLANKSEMIVINVMETEGCKWELEHCVEKHLSKTIFIVSCKQHEQLLLQSLSGTETSAPNIYENSKTRAVFMDEKEKRWRYKILRNENDVKQLVCDFLHSHRKIAKRAQKRKQNEYSLTAPFNTDKSMDPIVHGFNMLLQPLWCMMFNRWPIFWKIVFFIYCILAGIIDSIIFSYTDNVIVKIVCVAISILPWILFGDTVTLTYNRWGGREIAYRANKTLAKWILVFFFLTVACGFLTSCGK